MANEYRAHTYDGMDRAGDGTEAPTGLGPGRQYYHWGTRPRVGGHAAGVAVLPEQGLADTAAQRLRPPFQPRRPRPAGPDPARQTTWLHLGGNPRNACPTNSWRHRDLPISRRKCVEQINMLERQRRDIEGAIAELRQIYTEMFEASDASRRVKAAASRNA